jgi:hypothetical protein
MANERRLHALERRRDNIDRRRIPRLSVNKLLDELEPLHAVSDHAAVNRLLSFATVTQLEAIVGDSPELDALTDDELLAIAEGRVTCPPGW